jgi:tubulin polyglutamylase TTLL1
MSLKSVQSVIINDKHCFEMYGFDILLDSTCKPWLIEINSSPSLSTTTKSDLKLKMELIKNVFEIVVPEEWGEEYGKTGANTCTQTQVGRFTVLYDEMMEKEKKLGVQNSTKRNTSKVWR